MKIKFLKTSLGNINLNILSEIEKKEFSRIKSEFQERNNVLELKGELQSIRFGFSFFKCFYAYSDQNKITPISKEYFLQHETKYALGFNEGYKTIQNTISTPEYLFKSLQGEFELLYRFPKEHYDERYLVLDRLTNVDEYYLKYTGQLLNTKVRKGRHTEEYYSSSKTEYINFSFFDIGYEVGMYISKWDTFLNYRYINGKPVLLETKIKQENQNTEENTPKPQETLYDYISHDRKDEIVKTIISKYGHFKGYKLRALLMALKKLKLFPTDASDALFHRCCEHDFKDAGKYQSMEKHTFKHGHNDKKGNYMKSSHEELYDEIIQFLESIT